MANQTYHREAVTIRKIQVENFREGPDGEPNTVNVWLDTPGGSTVMWGGLALDADGIGVFLGLLMATFGVSRQEDLIGKKAIALRSWGGFQENIEGLLNETAGRKMTIRSFRKAMNFAAPSNLDERIKKLKNDIVYAEEQIKTAKQRLKDVANNYIEWD